MSPLSEVRTSSPELRYCVSRSVVTAHRLGKCGPRMHIPVRPLGDNFFSAVSGTLNIPELANNGESDYIFGRQIRPANERREYAM